MGFANERDIEVPLLSFDIAGVEPKEIKILCSDASEKELAFKKVDNNIYEIDLRVETLDPAILFIK